MNFSTNAYCGSHTSKGGKADASQVQRARQRTVLGVLSENELQSRSLSQGSRISKHSSASDTSQLTTSCPSSSSCDVYVEEAREVVLATSGQEEVSDSYYLDAEDAVLQDEHVRFLLELSSSSCQNVSMRSEPDESLMSEGVLCMSVYVEDIHRHMRESETKFRSRPGYLEKHPGLTNSMRVLLVDWLVEVVQEYQFCSETLHLAVNYLDRFLSCTKHLKKSKLQLVGTAALLIAAKYEEIFLPGLTEFVYITDNTYTKKQLVWMETFLLRVLDFNLAAPTAHQFIRLFTSVCSVCANTENLALYVAELSLQEIHPFLHYAPSIIAAGAYCLANYTVNKALWPEVLQTLTGYSMAEIVPCLTDLHKVYISAESHPQQAIRDKYKTSKYCHVSWITPPAALPHI